MIVDSCKLVYRSESVYIVVVVHSIALTTSGRVHTSITASNGRVAPTTWPLNALSHTQTSLRAFLSLEANSLRKRLV